MIPISILPEVLPALFSSVNSLFQWNVGMFPHSLGFEFFPFSECMLLCDDYSSLYHILLLVFLNLVILRVSSVSP